MRPYISIGLIFLLSWQTAAKLGAYCWYWANRDYISANLCVNRDRQDLACKGQCLLMQRLDAMADDEQQRREFPLRVAENLDLLHFVFNLDYLLDLSPVFYTQAILYFYTAIQSQSFGLGLLQPPERIAC